MIISILFACSLFAVAILTWLFRQRLARFLPRKETMTTATLFAAVALLLAVVLLPDILLLVYTLSLMPHSLRIILALAAATMVCVGCWKQADAPKPRRLQWSAPETGYQSETTLPPDPKPKEAP
jgi:hypothetical protein